MSEANHLKVRYTGVDFLVIGVTERKRVQLNTSEIVETKRKEEQDE